MAKAIEPKVTSRKRRSPGTDEGGEGGTSGNWGGGATKGSEKEGVSQKVNPKKSVR